MNQSNVNFYAQGYAPLSTKVGAFSDIGSPLGHNCKVQTGVSIPPGWNIGNNIFFGPGCRFANDKYPMVNGDFTAVAGVVEDDVSIGMGAMIGPGIVLGKGCKIGMGAVVTKDVPAGETWYGNPAKKHGT